jgi:hypothetical protein
MAISSWIRRLVVHLCTGPRVRFGHESSATIRHPHEIASESANQCASHFLTGPVFCPTESRIRARSNRPAPALHCRAVRFQLAGAHSGGLVQRDYARGGSGEGVRGPIAYLSRLLGGVHLLQRRTGFLFEQGPVERSPTLPGMSSGGEAGADRRRPAGISRRDLRQLRRPGHGPIRAAERPSRLLQLMLRQGSGRNPKRVRNRLTSARPTADEPTRPGSAR